MGPLDYPLPACQPRNAAGEPGGFRLSARRSELASRTSEGGYSLASGMAVDPALALAHCTWQVGGYSFCTWKADILPLGAPSLFLPTLLAASFGGLETARGAIIKFPATHARAENSGAGPGPLLAFGLAAITNTDMALFPGTDDRQQTTRCAAMAALLSPGV